MSRIFTVGQRFSLHKETVGVRYGTGKAISVPANQELTVRAVGEKCHAFHIRWLDNDALVFKNDIGWISQTPSLE